ncbi:hypothetical protein HHI36_010551 [Cryptolaemus montrouzieri]|uniref:Uncharacterized protein n=1 Tax=Cryptolaemus montrouzieri TaxID=559131 RepID=A0ABD2MJ51_9CUCU
MLQEFQEKERVAEKASMEEEKLLYDLNKKELEIRDLKMSIEEKTKLFKNELEDQMNNTQRLIQENENLSIQRKEFDEKMQQLSLQIQTRDSEFQVQIEKLNQDWQNLVDKRGSDVAESWKLHLESRETEFSQIQGQLRKEISDLEEKCNGLVNENNELRKNVDQEIRNEVDRMSALQQQIHERQQFIQELSQSVNDKQLQLEKYEKQILNYEETIMELQKTIEHNNIKINEMHILVDTIQKQFDQKRVIVEGIVRKLEEKSPSPILFDLESITEELNRQLNNVIAPETLSQIQESISDKDAIISNMRNELASKIEEINALKLTSENQLTSIEKLKQQIENTNVEDKLNILNTMLNEKDVILSDIQIVFDAKSKELEDSQKQFEELKSLSTEKENQITELQNKLSEKDDIISNISYQLQHTQSLKENENENVQNLQYSLQQYQLQYDELRTTLDQKNSLLDALNEELQKQHQIHAERETEVQNLKTHVEELQMTQELETKQLEKDKNDIIETLYQEVEILKNQLDSVSYLQSQLEEQNNNIKHLTEQVEYYKNINEEFSQKLEDYDNFQKKYEEQNTILHEDEKQLIELKSIIEEQVLKIESLKQKLYEKSNDYDSLIAEMDVRKEDFNLSKQDVHTKPPMGKGQLIGPTCEDDLNEWVSRPELDIALYMLHQRDVRCEELTVELTQLLEERDTLQLRLSNALREKEEYRKVASESGILPDISTGSDGGSPSKGAKAKGRVSEIVLKSSGTELAKEAQEISLQEPEKQLEHKLSELKNIGYKRDKTLLDEQQKRIQQLSIMQQHMDEASKLPPEAAARLVDANYTLSRDVQSPSKVLLNWLWGRSTPKVNEL